MTDPYAPFWLNIYKDGTDLQFPYRTSDVKAMAYRFRVIPWRPNNGTRPDVQRSTILRARLRNGMIINGLAHWWSWNIWNLPVDIIFFQIKRGAND